MINVFFPYYQCGDTSRQEEIDLCLKNNLDNPLIDNLYVIIDDDSVLETQNKKVHVLYISERLTYKKWILLTKEYCLEGISILCNSDIYFDNTLSCIKNVLTGSNKFIALSRWELLDDKISIHPNPHWSQDTWALCVDNQFSESFLRQVDFPMGVPRCDNKIAYLFSIYGWEVFNPVNFLKSIHVHETQLRTYDKKLDDRLLGGVAYVYASESLEAESKLDFDVWTKRTTQINKVALNKAMQRWIRESLETENIETEDNQINEDLVFEIASAREFNYALSNGDIVHEFESSFEVIQLQNKVFFKNLYQIDNFLSLDNDVFQASKQQATVAALVPPVLTSFTNSISPKPSDFDDVNFWQYPCATEKQAFENHLDISAPSHLEHGDDSKIVHCYLPLPWATFIDKKTYPEAYLARIKSLIKRYKNISKKCGYQLKVHSVCQHIHWIRILQTAEEIGVTDLHLSHKDSTSNEKQKDIGTKLDLHGWPLIAVNYVIEERSEGMVRKPVQDKKLLASFIGAHMKHYRDDSRIQLFEAAKQYNQDDVLVDLGNEWHFNKVVYEEQVLNKKVEEQHIDEHHQKTFRYNSILSDSKFSLCPEGAGPNTLRFWESIAVGSVPVIFSEDLAVFQELEYGKELLKYSVLWDEEISFELFSFLKKISESEIERKASSLKTLYRKSFEHKCFSSSKIQIDNGLTQVQHEDVGEHVSSELKKKLNLLYVGASVTAQRNGYRPSLNKLLSNIGYEVVETVLATGATGSIFGLCNLSTLKDLELETFDIAFYEYSTGDLNIGLTPLEEMEEIVFQSLKILGSISEKVILINNYRSDYEGGKGNFVRDKHRIAAKRADVNILDVYPLFEEMRSNLSSDEWKKIYRDNVHTSEYGSEILAKNIIENFSSFPTEFNHKKLEIEDLTAGFYYPFSQLKPKNVDRGTYIYPSSGQTFEYIILDEMCSLELEMKGELWGLISIVGPKSGWVEVKVNGETTQKFCQLDAHCYYTRVQPRQFTRRFDDFVTVSINLVNENLDFSIVKQTHKEHKAPRQLNLSCFMGSNVEIRGVEIKGRKR